MIRIVINIAQDAFTIINASPEMATLKLYDAAGRLADPGWSIASGSSRTIGVLSVPSGIYYLNGWFGSRWVTQKIVIWH